MGGWLVVGHVYDMCNECCLFVCVTVSWNIITILSCFITIFSITAHALCKYSNGLKVNT